MKYEEYRRHDATGLAALVAAGEVTSDELLTLARERLAEVNPSINAVVADVPDQPVTAGPLAGVPFLVKDLGQDVAGVPTSSGSRATRLLVATEDSAVVRRWRAAGLRIFGKTNTPEFGAKGITESQLWGPARNPWNLEHTPGGSSGGSAAAVAAGVVPAAGANDGGGSIRIPAACCGLVGLKPSRGLVPSGPGCGESMHGAAVQGVVTRTVRDTAALLDVMAGDEPDGPFPVGLPGAPYAAAVGADPGRLRIGVRVPSAITPAPHREAYAAVQAAVAALTDLGHDVEDLAEAPYDDDALARDFLTTWFVGIAREVDEARRVTGAPESAFERDTRVMAALGRAIRGVDYLDAVERRYAHTRRLTDFFADHDLLLTPTLATPPPRVGAFDLPTPLARAADVLLATRTARVLGPAGVVDDMVGNNLGWVPYTQLANLTGRPAISVPLHWTADGLPLGVQFVGPLGAESRLIALAAQLEAAVPWAGRVAPL